MLNILIMLGFFLIVLAILFAMPFLGVGMVIPVLGDMIDIPLSAVFAVVGIALLIVGGLFQLILDFWWVLLLLLLLYVVLIILKIKFFRGRGR